MIGVETRPLSRASRMDRLKTKRSARRAQNMKILQEAQLLLTEPTVDKPKLSAGGVDLNGYLSHDQPGLQNQTCALVGGWWERLVRSVKPFLCEVLEKSKLNSKETETVLLEVEAVINSRPLTYTYRDPREPSPLCPAHILVGSSFLASPERTNSDDEARSAQDTRRDLSKLRYRQKLVDHLWIRWKKEYLLQLRALHLCPSHPSSSLQVDDVVLIEKPNMSRGLWPLGRVVDVLPGQDGIIRACRVKAEDGKFIRRPVQKLYKLEVDNATGGWQYVEKEE
ncbi:hypothetical protein HPB49_009842 [Dermacentor silvarum]|uniref:Uncharacterized protein n=1 Tax=Dermacentor silvarum TaxID=543639 RepID=A0ACB8CEA8_DERSI|nr:hypothetical protein HPB49_009842 [Dermacentor silvarum]